MRSIVRTSTYKTLLTSKWLILRGMTLRSSEQRHKKSVPTLVCIHLRIPLYSLFTLTVSSQLINFQLEFDIVLEFMIYQQYYVLVC